jgi:ferrous iron transport protein A
VEREDYMGCYGNCSRINFCQKNAVKLNSLKVGDEGVVVAIAAEEDVRLKIMEMGLTNATKVVVTKKSPLGDPISIKVRGYELMLRNKEAEAISVNRIEK